MNKTVSINLGGQVFQIDENAFEKLSNYLESIRNRFSGTEGSDEIIADIESRIAEMFSAKLSDKKEVIMLPDVEEVIGQMGRPEDFAEIEDEDEEPLSKKSKRKGRRFYRNQDDKVIGGVCSGLSAYLGINDPIWLRILFLAAFIFGVGGSLIVYIILWVIVPEAETTSQKLEMKGEPINISNIEKTIKEDLGDIKSKFEHMHENRRHGRNFFERFIDLFISIAVFLFKFIIKAIAVILVIAGTAMIIAFLLAFLVPAAISGMALPALYPLLFSSKLMFILGAIGLLLLLAIPAIVLVYLGLRVLLGMKVRVPGLGISATLLWVAGFILTTIAVARTSIDFKDEEQITKTFEIKQPTSDVIYIEASHYKSANESFDFFDEAEMILEGDSLVLRERVKFNVEKSMNENVALVGRFSARGRNNTAAYERAEQINYDFIQRDSLLQLSDIIATPLKDHFRDQEVSLTLKLPVGKSIFLTESSRDVIYDIKNITNTYDGNMIGHTWKMTYAGLECVDCNWESMGNRNNANHSEDVVYDFQDFDVVEAEGFVTVEVTRGDKFKVYVSANSDDVDDFSISKSGDKLKVKRRKSFSDHFGGDSGDGIVFIEMPELSMFELSGASEAKIRGFDSKAAQIDISGACKATIDSEINDLELSINGASKVILRGRGNYMKAEINGSSKLQAFDFETDKAKVEVNGIGSVEINVSDYLEAEANGESSIEYKGLPEISSDVTGFSSIKPKQ